MSTEAIYVCNRCKKEVRKDRSGWMSLSTSIESGVRDLCPKCKEEFAAFMSGKSFKA